jgi:hypothetical protein
LGFAERTEHAFHLGFELDQVFAADGDPAASEPLFGFAERRAGFESWPRGRWRAVWGGFDPVDGTCRRWRAAGECDCGLPGWSFAGKR